MTYTATILGPERVALPDGRQFRGVNAETDAARALIADGADPSAPLAFAWADGRPSTHGTVGAYARWRLGDDGRQLWRPHPMAETPPRLVEWAAKIRAERRP